MRILAFIVTIVVAAATFSKVRVPVESGITKFSSDNWISSPALPTDTVSGVFVLKKDSDVVRKFEEQLIDLATPSSKNYGKWLSKAQIIDQLSPPQSHVEIVTNFLKEFGIKPENIRVSDYRDKIFVTMPVAVAGNMLETSFSRFRSAIQPEVVLLRTNKGYSLPSDIASVVSLVDDIVRLPSVRRVHLTDSHPPVFGQNVSASPFSSCGAKCNGYTTPAVLQQAYSFSPVTAATQGNGVAVAEFQYQYYDNADLQSFSSACGVTVTVDETIGGNNEKVCNAGCVEALLDIEYLGAIVHPIPLTTIYSGTYSLLNWVDGVISMANPDYVQSVSYGNDEVQQTSTEYMEEVNTQFAVAGSLGISILFASGDQGVWGRTGVGATYHPDFPAGSPYVTAVGGTNFATQSVIGPESAWSCGGGGFSDTFPIPSWQQTEVNNYLTTAAAAGVLPKASLFNAAGRGYPDVSALGGQTNPYCVAIKGGTSFGGVAGTSASCPVVAGVIGLLNNVRLANGKSSLGFLNPFLYANPSCFNDVNDGSQNNCNAGTQGFAALNGWDPATGLGTPNYSCLAGVI